MPKISTVLLALLVLVPLTDARAYTQPPPGFAWNQSDPSERMPSQDEIEDLLSKASEYVDEYRHTFKSAKASLDRTSTPGFYDKAVELSGRGKRLA
jgi:hypothetical protein